MDLTLVGISLISLGIAAAMSVVAWRMVRDERQRSAARVAALAAEIHDQPPAAAAPAPRRGAEVRDSVDDLLLNDAPVASSMFATQSRPAHSRTTLVGAVAALVVGAAAALTILLGSSGSGVAEPSSVAGEHASKPDSVAPVRKAAPLELVALGHERDRDGLTVRGILRNPAGGTEVSHLTAVVLLFNREGGYVASGRAAVEAPTLEPGAETTFVVTVSGAPDVERYRVSFRTDRDVVPHIDHRS